MLEIRRVADPKRGGGEDLVTRFTYEALYNQVASTTDPRGNAANFEPPLGMASAGRYTTHSFYDYQEGTAEIAGAMKFGIDLTGVERGLGDLNGDGRTDQVAGKRVHTEDPVVTLLGDSKEAARLGSTSQQILSETQWNDRGQLLREIDPEGNVSAYDYYPAEDPDGDGVEVPTPVGADASGYLRLITVDAMESPRRLSPAAHMTPAPFAHGSFVRYSPWGRSW